MWKCHKCGKPVYFAERKTSLGYEWHPECLRCEECGKRLNPGQHAEHKGVPYCHIPCYSVLFGPSLYGHGSKVEAHSSFGKIENRQGTPVPRSHLEAKLKMYNNFFDGKSGAILSRERNGRLILEGSLRIFWGVNQVIHLKEDHDERMPVRRRNSVMVHPNSHGEPKDGADSPPSPSKEAKHQTLPGETETSFSVEEVKHKLFTDEETPLAETETPLLTNEEFTSELSTDGEPKTPTLKEEKPPFTDEDTNIEIQSIDKANPFTDDKPETPPLTDKEKSALIQKDPNLLNSLLTLPMSDEVPLSEIALDVKMSEKELITETLSSPTHYKTLPAGGLRQSQRDNSHTLLSSPESPTKEKPGAVQLKRRPRVSKSRLKRRCSINGHFYNRETSVFKPAFASITSVWVTSLVTGPEVINMLLDKFKVVNNPGDFALYVVRDTGERRCIQDHEYPLLVRVMLGPCEDVAKVFIMNKYLAKEIPCEVAQYLNFSETELKMFLRKFTEEEKKERLKIIRKYQERKRRVQFKMDELTRREIQQTGL